MGRVRVAKMLQNCSLNIFVLILFTSQAIQIFKEVIKARRQFGAFKQYLIMFHQHLDRAVENYELCKR